MKLSKRTCGNLLLLLAAFIWGTAFVAQKTGVDSVNPITFNGIRSILGYIALLPVIFVADFKAKKSGTYIKDDKKMLYLGGLVCGLLLFFASTCQTAALVEADAGKGGFMTALYLVIVPVLGIFMGKKTRIIVWVGVVLATFGLYFVCIKESLAFSFNTSEILLLICALLFAVHIIAVDYFAPKVNGVKLASLQFLTVGAISLVYILFIDKPNINALVNCAFPLVYAGVISLGVGNTLQVVAQKDTEPATASIIMSMESLFALLAGIALAGESPSVKELFGCALMMAAIILVQLPQKKKLK